MATAHKIDDYRLPKLDRFEAPDRFDKLDKIFKKAEKEGVVAPLPNAEQEVRLIELNESRNCTIRTRLYLLGYLKRDNHSPIIGDRFKSAVHRFQKEAGLKSDSWVGRQTWTALQELVSFEHPSHLEKWFTAEPLKPALLRAIKLRLFVLGFLPSKQTQAKHKLQKALEKFAAVARVLNLHDQPLLPRPVIDTINVLFDQDGLSRQLGRSGKHFMKHRPADIGEKATRRKIRRFTICCAKIELWLLGYDLPLDGSARFDTPGGSEKHPYLPARYPLFHALYSFWRENGKGKQEARKRAAHVKGSFFARLLHFQQADDRTADTNQSDQLFEVLSNEKKKVLDSVWGQIKTIGSRIWDGLKRVWRWLKSIITRTVEKIGTWAKNIARLAYQYALNAFPVIRQLIKITKETTAFLTHKTLKDSDVACIVISRDNDYDYRLFINSDHDRDGMKAILTKFYSTAYYFSIGMRVLGIIGSALMMVIKNIPFGGGWFGLILALLKIYSSLKNFSDILDEERAFMATV